MWITFNKSLAGIPLERIIICVNNAIMKDVQTQPAWKRDIREIKSWKSFNYLSLFILKESKSKQLN